MGMVVGTVVMMGDTAVDTAVVTVGDMVGDMVGGIAADRLCVI